MRRMTIDAIHEETRFSHHRRVNAAERDFASWQQSKTPVLRELEADSLTWKNSERKTLQPQA